MSILNDLDPVNARLPAKARVSRNRLLPWASAILLLLAGMSWIYFANPLDVGTPPAVPAVAVAAEVPTTPPPPTPSAAASPSETEPGGTALIRNTPTGNEEAPGKQANAFAALQAELAATEKPTIKAAEPAPSVAAKANQQKEQKSRATAKTAKRNEHQGSANGQRHAKAAKKPNERDIDIISAIVR